MISLFEPGEQVAGHEILHHLDTCGPAEVYAALGPTGEPCALEVVTTETWLTASVYVCLREQEKAIARIAHPGVVRPDGAGVWDDQVWRSFELIEGDTLRRRLHAGRPPLDVALGWMLQACDAIAEAHRGGVIHGSLTPDTLIVTAGDTVKVVGFGLAALRGHGIRRTDEERLVAALHRAPEQSFGGPIDAGWDVYAMGLMLYELLTGIHPMGNEARALGDVLTWHFIGAAEPLLSLVPDAPPALAALVHRAMEREAAERLQSMRALADGVRDAIDGLRAPPAPADRDAVIPAVAPPRVSAPGEARGADVPVESAVRRASVTPRRARGVGIAVGAVAVTVATAATGWMVFGRVSGLAFEPSPAPRPAASAVPPARASVTAPPSPAASASGTPATTGRTPAVRTPPAKSRRPGIQG